MILDRKVTVCDKCFMACCWHGIFMCDGARYAGTVEKTIGELRELNREHPREHYEYWFKNPATGAIDQHAMAEYSASQAGADDARG